VSLAGAAWGGPARDTVAMAVSLAGAAWGGPQNVYPIARETW
jgi:hypothetical protein